MDNPSYTKDKISNHDMKVDLDDLRYEEVSTCLYNISYIPT